MSEQLVRQLRGIAEHKEQTRAKTILRAGAVSQQLPTYIELEAADEIERLERALAARDQGDALTESYILEAQRLRVIVHRLRKLLQWLDRKGGLGLDVHERIREALSGGVHE